MPATAQPIAADVPEGNAAVRVLRWLAVWLVACSAAAAPSSYIAADTGYDRGGMVVGVLCFVAAYTAFTATRSFARRYARDPALRRTMLIGYGLRVLIAPAALVFPTVSLIDMMPGLVSTGVVRSIGLPPKEFADALLTTLVQGVLLNFILALLMAVVYPIARVLMPPPAVSRRGFAVVPMVAAAATHELPPGPGAAGRP